MIADSALLPPPGSLFSLAHRFHVENGKSVLIFVVKESISSVCIPRSSSPCASLIMN